MEWRKERTLDMAAGGGISSILSLLHPDPFNTLSPHNQADPLRHNTIKTLNLHPSSSDSSCCGIFGMRQLNLLL